MHGQQNIYKYTVFIDKSLIVYNQSHNVSAPCERLSGVIIMAHDGPKSVVDLL